eukprot:CAMPEP_0201941076 /NCGR_PEP_ID=MMETSP0903-20130614/46456_1 /ASSEMBLY_ACC=CAM_ASM_000552 /TAXON_ID=420261 /ORGANISM="Thalassiosira antarctica, Strain CCMP982" /LENGTH=139 /DNA_ID=CAMNT_0048483043 /DNA_START=1 /DNA_END=417 /DNA_ORIENTATION=+
MQQLKSTAPVLEIVQDAIHRAVLMILRGICYETVERQSPLLSLESLRPVTGMLLPKLYPHSTKEDKGKDVVDERSMDLWNEILLLLSPYSDSLVGGGKRKCCQNWSHVAPMAATAILCILLPTFRKMELPSVVSSSDTP